MELQSLIEISNVLVLPAFGYIIVLERRITRLQTQIELLLERVGHG